MSLLKRTREVIRCHKCGGIDMFFFKIVGFGFKKGVVFHYKCRCKKCGRERFVRRTAEIYNQVKNQKWHFTRNYKKFH